jgi:hypothetical protein
VIEQVARCLRRVGVFEIGISPLELHGAIECLRIEDGFAVAGGGFDMI